MQTFEDFLKEIHAKLYPQLLDDDLAESFETWICEIQIDDLIDWVNLYVYGRRMRIAGKEEILLK